MFITFFTSFHKFSQVFTSFHKFSQVFTSFHKFSQVFTSFKFSLTRARDLWRWPCFPTFVSTGHDMSIIYAFLFPKSLIRMSGRFAPTGRVVSIVWSYYLDQKYDINFKGVYLYFVQIEFKKRHEVWKRL
jgi:hypothetical protein